MWLPVTASRHAGLDPASSLKRDASQPLINPDSDKNFGNEYSGAGVPACDSPLDCPSRAVNGGQGRPPHYCEHITLSQNPDLGGHTGPRRTKIIIEHQHFWPRLFTPVVIVAQASGPFIVAQASLPAIRFGCLFKGCQWRAGTPTPLL